ncbi:hypothetical protein SADUNF_Sadunf15G0041500 [Salix dunnii]|uniref:Uncharacterized protein n=1 Tax=Salix dunnii TaxID=1413687 RepID=A0A835MKW6_9ROSI|nr:hypothetical protein SADUNF_Sadunf15G0041500 [Salix dunnii]
MEGAYSHLLELLQKKTSVAERKNKGRHQKTAAGITVLYSTGHSCVHILLEGFSFLLMGLEDLLYKDYQNDNRFTLTTFSPTGDKGEFLAADVNTRLKKKNYTVDIKVDTSSNVEVQYLDDYAATS